MDPIAHTLVGATLAESGLRRATPLATATLVIGANAPDADIISSFLGGGDASLYWRRGVTHGVLAMVVLPLVLTGVMLAWDRFVRRRRHPDAAPARAGPLLVLSFVSILTHPALDWLNTYGVRLLMPFDGTWFYGDSVFIVDPWMWLLMAASVVLARTRGKLSAAAWIVVACAATALVLLFDRVPIVARVVWLIGVVAIVVLRLRRVAEATIPKVAIVCLSVLLVYIGAMLLANRVARVQAAEWLASQGVEVDEIMAGAVAVDPFERDVIARSGDRYLFLRVAWLDDPPIAFTDDPIRMGERTEIVERALLQVPGLRTWLRFPAFEVRETPDGHTVHIHDVRYSRERRTSLGSAVVEVPR
jgi:inner membrane protein